MSTRVLWVLQGLLAVVFLMAGAGKLTLSEADLAAAFLPPASVMRAVAVLELLGAAGLVLPGLVRRGLVLTPLAAAGLAGIMLVATVTTVLQGQVAASLIPLALAIVAGIVATGRWRRLDASERHGPVAARHS